MGSKLVSEDIHEFEIDDVPPLVYKTELDSFNEYDDREFPSKGFEVANWDDLCSAFHSEVVRMNKFVRKLAVGVGLAGTLATMDGWFNAENMVTRVVYLRKSFNATKSTLEERYKNVPEYGDKRFEEYIRNYLRLISIVEECRVIHSKLNAVYLETVAFIENSIGLMGGERNEDLIQRYSDIKMNEYEDVRKSLLRKRRELVNKREDRMYV